MIHRTSTSVRILSHWTRQNVCALSSSASTRAVQPNPPVTLDPTLKTLLQGVDLSVSSHKKKVEGELHSRPLRELEPFQDDKGDVAYYSDTADNESDALIEPTQRREDRKSPAARFGANRIGSVVLPPELQRAITSLINGAPLATSAVHDAYSFRKQIQTSHSSTATQNVSSQVTMDLNSVGTLPMM